MRRMARSALLAGTAFVAASAVVWSRRRPRRPDKVFSADEARVLYDRLAPFYDVVASVYQIGGAGRVHAQAVDALNLTPGDTVVDLGCGTGENLPHLIRAVGPSGRVVCVDLSPAMLARARARARRHGWSNVEFIVQDVRDYSFQERLGGVVSTYALEFVPEHDAVIERGATALAPGRRIAIGGLRRPRGWPGWLIRTAEWLNRPFGVTPAYENVTPWTSLFRHAREVRYSEALLGAVYLAVAEAR